MNNSLLAGVFEPGSNLITEISGNGNYEADRPEGYDFNVGDIYTATASDIEFELKVKEVDDKRLFLNRYRTCRQYRMHRYFHGSDAPCYRKCCVCAKGRST